MVHTVFVYSEKTAIVYIIKGFDAMGGLYGWNGSLAQ
jgi:hypothetical protein